MVFPFEQLIRERLWQGSGLFRLAGPPSFALPDPVKAAIGRKQLFLVSLERLDQARLDHSNCYPVSYWTRHGEYVPISVHGDNARLNLLTLELQT